MASFKKNDHSASPSPRIDTSYPDFNPVCVVVGFHQTGIWCSACQRLGMPWQDTLPVVGNDSEDEEDKIAPKDSLLEGVDIHNPAEVNIVALVADFGLRSADRPDLLVRAADLPNFRTLELAGRRVELLTRRLEVTRGETWRVLKMGEVLQMALIDPSYSADQLFDFIRTLRHLLLPGVHLPAAPAQSEKTSSTNEKDDEEDDKIDFEEECALNPNYDRFESPKHKNKPTKEGEWKFLEGQDLSKAKVGKPDPSKFFIARELVGGKVEDKDIRYFVRWKHFDWHDPLHIERLNKWMQQLSYRTLGTDQAAGDRWTAREKDEMIRQVAHKITLKPTARNQIWPKVFEGMVSVFGKLMQKRGDPLAVSTKLKLNGDIVRCTSKPGKLDDDRFGWDREMKTVINKSDDFGEVKKLLQEYFQDSRKRKSGDAEGDGDEEEAVEGDTNAAKPKETRKPATKKRKLSDDSETVDNEDASEKDKTKEKPKLILRLKPGPDAPNGRPGPPPPPGTGGADFSGTINNSSQSISAC